MKKKTAIQFGIFLVIAIAVFFSLRLSKFGAPPSSPIPASVIGTVNVPDTIPAGDPTPAVVPPVYYYVEITGGCNYAFIGTCVKMRSGPGTEYPAILLLRTGIVFKVEAGIVHGIGGDWYKVIFDKDIRYPERIKSDWYVPVDPNVLSFSDQGDIDLNKKTTVPTNKRIVVSISEQKLDAYDGNTLFMEEPISSGSGLTPTSIGKFTIFRKTPSRYMQGPIPGLSDEYYDLPGIPWDLYFTADGAVFHGAYWHNNFGHPMSHGCINQSPENAKKLYYWADIGTSVTVKN